MASSSQTWDDTISESRATASNKQLPLHCGHINYIMWKSSVRSWSPTPLLIRDVKTVVVTLPEHLNSVACCILISECIDWLYLGWWLGNNRPKTKIHCSLHLSLIKYQSPIIAKLWFTSTEVNKPLQSAESTALQVKAYLCDSCDTPCKTPCILHVVIAVYPSISAYWQLMPLRPTDYYRVMGVGSLLHPTGLGAPGPVQDAVAR